MTIDNHFKQLDVDENKTKDNYNKCIFHIRNKVDRIIILPQMLAGFSIYFSNNND